MPSFAALSTFALLAVSGFASAAPVSNTTTTIEKRDFSGVNSGIGSWFRTNAGSDYTNGHSWCQTEYQDSWMGFAPSLAVMQYSGGHDLCGRQAKFTNPNNGKTAYLYVVDAFAHPRSEGSTDLTIAAYQALTGDYPTSKYNDFIRDLRWEFTGGKKSEYSWNGGN